MGVSGDGSSLQRGSTRATGRIYRPLQAHLPLPLLASVVGAKEKKVDNVTGARPWTSARPINGQLARTGDVEISAM